MKAEAARVKAEEAARLAQEEQARQKAEAETAAAAAAAEKERIALEEVGRRSFLWLVRVRCR